MEKGNFVYSGWRANGFVALVGLLVLIAGGIALCVLGSDEMDPRIGLRTAMLVCGACLFFIRVCSVSGDLCCSNPTKPVSLCFSVNTRGLYETGFGGSIPLWDARKFRCARNLNVEPIKVNDKNGKSGDDRPGAGVENPSGRDLPGRVRHRRSTMGGTDLAVSASARMKVLENFVSVQSDAALRQVAGYYAYDNNGVADDELTLRSNSDEINDQLEAKLNDRLSMAGIEVIEARINLPGLRAGNCGRDAAAPNRPMRSSRLARRSSREPSRWSRWLSTGWPTTGSWSWTRSARRLW